MNQIFRSRGSVLARGALLLAALLMFVIQGVAVQAVHKTGKFQLEGDAQTSSGDTTQLEDWDLICKAHPTTCTFQSGLSPSGSTTSTASQHIADGSSSANDGTPLNSSIFSGGGSKDPIDITEWAWKNESGGLPDKDNILHGFASRYSTPTSTNCPSTSSTCDVLYFGMDRYDNSGDAQLGFWFFKSEVGLGTAKSGGGTKFTGEHEVGDLLVLADFSNGGSVATINAYKWVGSGGDTNGTLDFLGGSDNAKCTAASIIDADPFCGSVNPTNGTIAPWNYTDKTGNNTYLNGEFFEGGINLSDPSINLAGTCFASFMVESRSSTSPTATLKDFALGGFGSCQSSLSSAQSWVPNDSATVSVTGINSWSGTLGFALYDNALCDGTPVYEEDFDPVTSGVQPKSVNQSTSFPVSTSNSTYKVTASGSFSWKVTFTSATTGVDSQSACEKTDPITITN